MGTATFWVTGNLPKWQTTGKHSAVTENCRWDKAKAITDVTQTERKYHETPFCLRPGEFQHENSTWMRVGGNTSKSVTLKAVSNLST